MLHRAALVVFVLALASATFAAQSVTEGHVVSIESDDVIVDVAAGSGAKDGDIVELWRPLELKHPVTGKRVRDRFKIGALELVQVRDALAIAKPHGKLTRQPRAGDVVVLRRAVLEPAPEGAPQAIPAPTAPWPQEGADPEARAVAALFDGLRNAPVARRIARYEGYVREHPQSRFAAVLYEEAQVLRRLLQLESGARSNAAEPELERFEPPDSALAGVPLDLGLEIGGGARGAVLQLRNSGEVAYRPIPMRAAGKGYFTVTVPATRVRAGELQYFVEATTAEGRSVPVVASAEAPQTLQVHAIPTASAPPRHEATVSVLTDYADYNRWVGNDRVWQTEGYFGMRFRDEGIRALRTGFGVYRGVGGSLEELDELDKSGRKVGLTYGYLEGEYAFTSFTALVLRGVIGLRDDGVAGGTQALVRIGHDKRTNLLIGGEVLGGIGMRGITELQLNTFERVPIVLRTEVTNQPAGSASDPDEVQPAEDVTPAETSLERGEVGARAIAQVGYELFPGFVVAARGSYQGRTIHHAGPGFGGAVSYTW